MGGFSTESPFFRCDPKLHFGSYLDLNGQYRRGAFWKHIDEIRLTKFRTEKFKYFGRSG